MRYIGNKTKLLPAIEEFAADVGAGGESFLDVFAGTASVARRFKEKGYRVLSNDFMSYSYALQKAYVEPTSHPAFDGLLRGAGFPGARALRSLEGPSRLEGVIEAIAAGVPPRRGLVTRQFTTEGEAGRRFFTPENGRRIDGVLEQLIEWRRDGRLEETEYYVLLAPLLEAADRVANISGVYGAYLKHWDANTRRPLRLEAPRLVTTGRGHRAHREDANALVRRLEVDVLYIDPPYNHRQYAANYHVLEVIAELGDVEDLERYEASLYGKTGLRPYDHQRSEYCVQRKAAGTETSRCEAAFRDLVRAARCEHIIVSYNEEGILPRETIGAILAEETGLGAFDYRRGFREVPYRRFRSDAFEGAAGGRRYRVVEGRRRDEIREWLFHARKGRVDASLARK